MIRHTEKRAGCATQRGDGALRRRRHMVMLERAEQVTSRIGQLIAAVESDLRMVAE